MQKYNNVSNHDIVQILIDKSKDDNAHYSDPDVKFIIDKAIKEYQLNIPLKTFYTPHEMSYINNLINEHEKLYKKNFTKFISDKQKENEHFKEIEHAKKEQQKANTIQLLYLEKMNNIKETEEYVKNESQKIKTEREQLDKIIAETEQKINNKLSVLQSEKEQHKKQIKFIETEQYKLQSEKEQFEKYKIETEQKIQTEKSEIEKIKLETENYFTVNNDNNKIFITPLTDLEKEIDKITRDEYNLLEQKYNELENKYKILITSIEEKQNNINLNEPLTKPTINLVVNEPKIKTKKQPKNPKPDKQIVEQVEPVEIIIHCKNCNKDIIKKNYSRHIKTEKHIKLSKVITQPINNNDDKEKKLINISKKNLVDILEK